MNTPSRLVRVFISSTFRDFVEERDELVKKVFPELRRRCKDRFVEVVEVDLRWGITEEQSKSGETLRICLQEIDRCRPSAPVFFVGLLGERYGWIPPRDYFKEDVLDDPNFSWVKECLDGKSVTELEILHGVLRSEAMRDKAFFYFRGEGYQDRHWEAIAGYHRGIVPPLTREDFTNAKSSTPEADAAKQSDLMNRVREVSFKWEPKNYETPKDMASLVLEDLWTAINEVFPASLVPDALERESLEHRAFMQSRTRAYVERKGLFENLDAFADALGEDSIEGAVESDVGELLEATEGEPAGKKQPPAVRVVLGESGSGKSALLAAWLARRDPVFFHFIGATSSSASGSSMLRRLLAALRKHGAVPLSTVIPLSDEAMARILPDWLEKLSAMGGGILLFDAVNQLSTAHDRELWWWPDAWPANIRVIFSTLPGDALREMKRRGWASEEFLIRIPPLAPCEKHSLTAKYLERLSRGLDHRLQEQILEAPQTENPLFLRTVLDELRLRSHHENLNADLDTMLACPDPAALFVHVLKKLEQDFTPPEHPGLVHRALGLMGAALRGLSENELLQLLSPDPVPAKAPLPRHYWAPFFLALEESLVSREGQLSFFHDYLRQAVWQEYLDEEHERQTARGRLAETVIRWNEPEVFSTSLKAYGFEYGIRHLLAHGRTDESTRLLLDQDYRKAAALALRDPQPVLQDIAAVRYANATAATANDSPETSLTLTVLALTGREQLTAHLRQSLDQAATSGDWETGLALASAGESDATRLLLACRALTRENTTPPEADANEFRASMARWASRTGNSGWQELIDRILPPTPSTAQDGSTPTLTPEFHA